MEPKVKKYYVKDTSVFDDMQNYLNINLENEDIFFSENDEEYPFKTQFTKDELEDLELDLIGSDLEIVEVKDDN